jgi:aminoglycoside phosphotransferase family enzyme
MRPGNLAITTSNGSKAAVKLIYNGGNLSLREWFSVSWFYPDDFTAKKFFELEDAYFVDGGDVLYKFQKSSGVSFKQKWSSAVRELVDHSLLAPNLYVGLRVLSFVDHEPLWSSLYSADEVCNIEMSEVGNEVAIVMAKLPNSLQLTQVLKKWQNLSLNHVKNMVSLLSSFYLGQQQFAGPLFSSSPQLFFERSIELPLRNLTDFVFSYGGFLDTFTKAAFEESISFLNKFAEKNTELFLQRGKQGYVIDCHGALTTDAVYFRRAVRKPTDISIINRPRQQTEYRRNDVLFDVATLSSNLQAHGFYRQAKQFERIFFSENPELKNETLFNFYRCYSAAREAAHLISSPNNKTEIFANRLLAIALQASLGLGEPFLVVVDSEETEESLLLAENIQELVAAQVITRSQMQNELLYCEELPDLMFEEILQRASTVLDTGSPVVIVWPLSRLEYVIALRELVQRDKLNHVVAKLSLSSEEKLIRQLSEDRSLTFVGKRSENSFFKEKLEGLVATYVEPVIAAPQVAIAILNEIGRYFESDLKDTQSERDFGIETVMKDYCNI